MTTYSAISPTFQGATATTLNAASGDKLNRVHNLLLIVNNGGGSDITVTLEDVRTQQPAGATPSSTFADLTYTVPAGVRKAFYVGNTSRFTDDQGLISLTWSGTTTVTWHAYDV